MLYKEIKKKGCCDVSVSTTNRAAAHEVECIKVQKYETDHQQRSANIFFVFLS